MHNFGERSNVPFPRDPLLHSRGLLRFYGRHDFEKGFPCSEKNRFRTRKQVSWVLQQAKKHTRNTAWGLRKSVYRGADQKNWGRVTLRLWTRFECNFKLPPDLQGLPQTKGHVEKAVEDLPRSYACFLSKLCLPRSYACS